MTYHDDDFFDPSGSGPRWRLTVATMTMMTTMIMTGIMQVHHLFKNYRRCTMGVYNTYYIYIYLDPPGVPNFSCWINGRVNQSFRLKRGVEIKSVVSYHWSPLPSSPKMQARFTKFIARIELARIITDIIIIINNNIISIITKNIMINISMTCQELLPHSALITSHQHKHYNPYNCHCHHQHHPHHHHRLILYSPPAPHHSHHDHLYTLSWSSSSSASAPSSSPSSSSLLPLQSHIINTSS